MPLDHYITWGFLGENAEPAIDRQRNRVAAAVSPRLSLRA
jgi:hypothetical protein